MFEEKTLVSVKPFQFIKSLKTWWSMADTGIIKCFTKPFGRMSSQ